VAQDVAVNYSMSGKATPGTDYTLSGSPGQIVIQAGQTEGSVVLTALIDNKKEKPEKVTMTLQPGSGYNFGPPSGKGKKKKSSKAPSASVTITD
jgi:hypothetical protein